MQELESPDDHITLSRIHWYFSFPRLRFRSLDDVNKLSKSSNFAFKFRGKWRSANKFSTFSKLQTKIFRLYFQGLNVTLFVFSTTAFEFLQKIWYLFSIVFQPGIVEVCMSVKALYSESELRNILLLFSFYSLLWFHLHLINWLGKKIILTESIFLPLHLIQSCFLMWVNILMVPIRFFFM